MNFFNESDIETIFFKLNSTNVLVPLYDIPEGSNIKIAYMMKKNKAEVTKDNFESLLVCRIVSQNIKEGSKAIAENVSDELHAV